MENNHNENAIAEKKKSCINCGAELKYLPGSTAIACEYCGYEQVIKSDDRNNDVFQELELLPYLEKIGTQSHSQEISILQCKNCGANQHIGNNYKSLECVYCAAPLIVEDAKTAQWILPGAIIPFQLDKNKSHRIFSQWVRGLWFAPNKLQKATLDIQATKGLYLPYWTFDAQAQANYRGERGEYYYVNVPHTTVRNGKSVTENRQERRTRWYPANGTVSGFIDDTLIKATHQQKNKIPAKVGDWNLDNLQTFKNDYLAGFITEKYTLTLKDGHMQSVEEAERIVRRWAKHDIGGDTQRVHHIDMHLSEQTFKHILLPVYISSYKYKGKVYNFFINGQTGSISGRRPYAAWKIILTILAALLVVFVIASLT